MRKIAFALAVLGTTLLPALYAAPAHAQATRTWVSGVGDDANPCSRTAPCKTFAGAIAKTAAPGEITCLDPGGFGALTVTKTITLFCKFTSNGGVLVAGTNGITFAGGATDRLTIIGLDIEGVNSGLNGVNFVSGLELIIQECNIRNFLTNGVNVASSTSGARAFILNSQIINNGVNGTANTGGVNVASGGVVNVVEIVNSVLENNQNYAIQANGSNSYAVIANDVIGPNGLNIVGGGQVLSFGVPVAGNPANAGGSSVLGGSTNPTSHTPFN